MIANAIIFVLLLLIASFQVWLLFQMIGARDKAVSAASESYVHRNRCRELANQVKVHHDCTAWRMDQQNAAQDFHESFIKTIPADAALQGEVLNIRKD